MAFLAIVEAAFVALFVLTFTTQVVIPFFRGTPMLPFFRNEKQAAGLSELAQAETETRSGKASQHRPDPEP